MVLSFTGNWWVCENCDEITSTAFVTLREITEKSSKEIIALRPDCKEWQPV